MNPKALVALVAATAAAVTASVLVVTFGESGSKPAESKARFLETLAPRINDVAAITVKKTGKEFTIQRQGEGSAATWVMVEKGGYPVKFETVKKAVVNLSELRPIEPKTS